MLRQSVPPMTLRTSQSTIQLLNTMSASIIINLGLFYLYLCFSLSLFFFSIPSYTTNHKNKEPTPGIMSEIIQQKPQSPNLDRTGSIPGVQVSAVPSWRLGCMSGEEVSRKPFPWISRYPPDARTKEGWRNSFYVLPFIFLAGILSYFIFFLRIPFVMEVRGREVQKGVCVCEHPMCMVEVLS